MKLIGFIKEFNNIKEGQEFVAIKESNSNNQDVIEGIINYLNNGVYLYGWMGYFKDLEDSSLIAPDSYYTDGCYVWPSYFPYYLKKYPNYLINNDFLSHLSKKGFIIDKSKISSDILAKLEVSLSLKLDESDF